MWGRVPEGWESAPAACWCSWQANPFRAGEGGAFCGGVCRESQGGTLGALPGFHRQKIPLPVRYGRGILFCCNQSSERIRAERLRASAMTFSSSMRVSTPSR